MDKEISFSIENDILIKNVIVNQNDDGSFIINKSPIMTKDIFVKCFDQWIKKEGDNG